MNLERIFLYYEKHRGGIIGAVLGLVLAVLILILGFFKVLLLQYLPV